MVQHAITISKHYTMYNTGQGWPCSQFHQCLMFCTKVLFSSKVLAKKGLSYKILARKMLMKLTPRLNCINILCTAFTLKYPESVKTDDLTVFFTLL